MFVELYVSAVRSALQARWRGGPLAQEIDDAAQEVFALCFRGDVLIPDDDSREPNRFRRRLYTIVQNVARQVERKWARDHRRLAPYRDDSPLRTGSHESVSRAFDREWALAFVREARSEMERRARTKGKHALRRVELLELRFYHGLRNRDIARLWGMKEKLVSYHYKKALEELELALRAVVRRHFPDAPVDKTCARIVSLLVE